MAASPYKKPLRGFLSRWVRNESDTRAIFRREDKTTEVKCLYCSGETGVVNSRAQKRNNQVWRRRRCVACGALFTSHEAIDLSSALLVHSRGSIKPFLADMLFTEVLLALQDRKDCYQAAREVTSTVTQQLLQPPVQPAIEAWQISQAAAKVLKRLDKRAHLRYLAEHPSLQNKRATTFQPE